MPSPGALSGRSRSSRWPCAGLLASCLMVLATAGCASGFGGSTATDPSEALKRQVVELRQRATVAEMEATRLKRENARLEAELEEAEQARRAPAGSQMELEPTTPETIGLDSGIEETDLQEEPMVEPAAAPAGSEPSPEEAPAESPVPEPAAQEPDDAAAAPVSAPPAEAQRLYDQGYSLFHQQRYADAEAQFRRYVERYPRTDLTDNALFWIGECLYARGDFSAALKAFSETVERFPQANKVSDALLKAGRCLEALGDDERARRTFEEVARRYPGTAAAAQARDALRNLG